MKKLLVKLNMVFFGAILAAGLTLALPAQALAEGPALDINLLGTDENDVNSPWNQNVNVPVGHQVQYALAIHNHVPGTVATGVRAKVSLPSGVITSGTSTATVTSSNATTVTQSITVNVTTAGGGEIKYVPGSTQVTWDPDGDGDLEYNAVSFADGIVSGDGLLLGDLKGCNEFIIRISFLANVVGPQATPTPTPTPTPVLTPTPTPCASCNVDIDNTNNNNNENNNTNNNNVNVTVAGATTPTVAGMKTLPETGAFAILLTALVGAIPLGLFLKRYRSLKLKLFTDESASKLADGKELSFSDLVRNRVGLKKKDRV